MWFVATNVLKAPKQYAVVVVAADFGGGGGAKSSVFRKTNLATSNEVECHRSDDNHNAISTSHFSQRKSNTTLTKTFYGAMKNKIDLFASSELLEIRTLLPVV